MQTYKVYNFQKAQGIIEALEVLGRDYQFKKTTVPGVCNDLGGTIGNIKMAPKTTYEIIEL